ncbi:uncharacterized [Tachysurus ichikawai]
MDPRGRRTSGFSPVSLNSRGLDLTAPGCDFHKSRTVQNKVLRLEQENQPPVAQPRGTCVELHKVSQGTNQRGIDQNYTEPHITAQNYTELHRTTHNHTEPHRTTQNCTELHRTAQNHTELIRTT